VPGRKFSTTTSALAASLYISSRASGRWKSIAMKYSLKFAPKKPSPVPDPGTQRESG
jgi:hypothetical protein